MTVILDESCASLENEAAALAPVFVFKRKNGFLTPTREAVVELEQCLSGTSRPSPPYILVSASFGGFTAIMYASRNPELVAGLVLVDSSHPRLSEVALDLLPALAQNESAELREFGQYLGGFGPAWETSRREISEIKTLGDTPMIVLAAGNLQMPSELDPAMRQAMQCAWLDLQAEHAALSSRGRLQVVPNSGHGIVSEAPEVVIEAIRTLRD